MENIVKLNEAFCNFTRASKSLETYYKKLGEKVQYLTHELEKKNAQLEAAIQEVQESKDYLHTVIQSIGEAIIVLDQHEKITMINRAARHLLCLDSRNISGTTFGDLDCKIEKCPSGTELTVKGRRYDVIMSRSKVTDSKGTIRGYVILIKDITRLKELERQQERNQRLISMGEMAAKIVHEIRSPLCSIELFSNMLSKDLEGTSHSEMAQGISTSIKSLNNILTNMLLFARPQKLSFKEIKLRDIIEESIKMLIALIEVRGINIYRKFSDETIEGDSELLKQVFMNVILNAIQAMPEGGTLEIKMSRDGESVVVAVVDEGEGIDPENVEKIFDPFFSTKEKGTGLGLAIAHRIMQGHNGFIKAEKNKDKGSTFYLCFPYKKMVQTVPTVQTVPAVQTVEKF
jgi:nitrogen fixation/metabolism regulation signal transduction histidine kinase